MRFLNALLALSSVVSAVSAQTIPDCDLQCLSAADLGGCTSTDNLCLCNNKKFIQSTTACFQQTCTGSDLANSETAFQAKCAAVGVTLSSTLISTGTSTSASNAYPTSTPTATAAVVALPPHSHTPVGALIGGLMGGCVVLSAVIFAALYVRRRKHRNSLLDISTEAKIPIFGSHNGHHLMPSEVGSLPHMSSSGEEVAAPVAAFSNRHARMMLTLPQPSAYPVPRSPRGSTPHEGGIASPAAEVTLSTQRPSSSANEHTLTPGDTRFFANLYNLNVPATEIASMMEAVRAERETVKRTGGSSSGIVHRDPEVGMDGPPPRYDFKAN